MKILGLDLGSKTLGVAISDALGMMAHPIGTHRIETNDLQSALDYVKMIVKEHQISKIVLGLPKNMDGSVGFQGQYCLTFKQMIEEQTSLEVILIDERLTSKMANQVMLKADLSRKKRKSNVDTLAASIILQTYLDTYAKYK